MSHLDPSSLAQYNSLIDPHLQSYFSNERIQSHLRHAGLISGRGEIISDSEYRTRLTRREHKNHVRHVLAENIVNRAIDMERTRRAEMKRQFDMVAKAALVNNIKESRRRSGTFGGLMSNSGDMALLSLDSSWVKTRPKSANHQNETNGLARSPRLQSAHSNDHHRGKSLSKTRDRRRSRRRLKNRSSSTQNRRSPTKFSDSSVNPCQITMVYYGPTIKVDYDHLVFEPIDEIVVMQQHCGGENIIVYKEHLKPGAEFTFDSRRHSDYPFGLTLYVKGYIDSRISTCCEYKHRHGVRLGGDRGHFAIKSVKGSKPCIKCRFEKQARLNRYAQLPKDKNNENKKPITIPLSATDERKVPQTPTKIPVRHTSTSKENYPEDFDGSDIQKRSNRDEYSSDEKKSRPKTSKSKQLSPIIRKVRRRHSSTSDETPKEKKTWQIKFYTTNIPKEKNFSIKFSLISNDKDNETETYEINKKQFDQNSKENKFYSFSIKLKNIGKPTQIRLKIYASNDNSDDDDDENEDIKWYLDYIELIDQENKSNLIFPCKQSIRPLQEKILRLSQESPRNERVRKTSASTNSSRPSSANDKTRQKTSVRPSTLSIASKKSNSSIRISPDNQSDESTPRNDQENKIRYRVTIYPSDDDDGSFNPGRDSRIYLRLNNQTKETILRKKIDRTCPTFESGEKQSFELDFIQNINEKPKKLTIGYFNSDITAMKWKIDKIVLVNLKTNEQFVFPCKRILHRDESNFRAEKTFDIQSNSSDEESTPRNRKINSPKSDDEKQRKNDYSKRKSSSSKKLSDNDSDEEKTETRRRVQTKMDSTQKSSLLKKLSDDDSDEEKAKTRRNLQTKVDSTQKSSLLQKPSDDDSDEEKTETRGRVQTKMDSTQKSSLLQKLSDDDSDEEQTTTPRNLQTKEDSTQQSSLLKKLTNRDSDEEQIETFTNPEKKTNDTEKPTLLQKQNNDSDEEQINTPPIPKVRTNNTEKSSSLKNLNDDDDNKKQIETPEKQQKNDNNEEQIKTPKNKQTNNYSGKKSPSFQSMNDEEADYKTIFKILDPENELKIGSRYQSPVPQSQNPEPQPQRLEPQSQSPEPRHQNFESRPKTRRGPQDQNNQQNSFQLVDPLVGLDELNNQTARSNDQLTQNSLPSTTTNNEETPRRKRHPTNNDDTNEEDN